MKAASSGWGIVLLGLLSVVQAPCQPGPASAVEPQKAITSTSREGLIHLDVAVQSGGEPVPGLTAKDFTLRDNGVPQKIISFQKSVDAGDDNQRLTQVILVLDEINLSPVQFAAAKSEAIKFLQRDGGHLAQTVSVYWLGMNGLYASSKPSMDGNVLAEEVDHRHPPHPVWANADRTLPMSQQARWVNSIRTVYSIAVAMRDKPGRKLLVWIGYGWPPSGSGFTGTTAFPLLVELETRIREARMELCQIPAWPDRRIQSFDYQNYLEGIRSAADLTQLIDSKPYSLQVQTIRNGGLLLQSERNIELGIEHCVTDASSFYTVSFDPPQAAKLDEYHAIKVEVDKPGASVRTNAGYYDEPVFYDQPPVPATRVTVRELEQILDKAGSQNDRDLTKLLAGLELTERWNSNRLFLWTGRLHGKQARAALTVLADESAFLEPPAAEVVADSAPDTVAQQQILTRTANYLAERLPQLPDFFATRTTVSYEQKQRKEEDTWKTALADQSLHEAATDRTTILYRNGHEERSNQKKKGRGGERERGVNFIGVFGPILNYVLGDITRGESKLIWSRWQKGERGKEAVFRYEVHGRAIHYAVQACCLRGSKVFRTSPEYHGELIIDPETGAILRLTMESEPGWIVQPNLEPMRLVQETGTMVEYGPVEISGRQYTCPLRSVVRIRARTVVVLAAWDETVEVHSPYQVLLNDVAYTSYHKFGSEARILIE